MSFVAFDDVGVRAADGRVIVALGPSDVAASTHPVVHALREASGL